MHMCSTFENVMALKTITEVHVLWHTLEGNFSTYKNTRNKSS